MIFSVFIKDLLFPLSKSHRKSLVYLIGLSMLSMVVVTAGVGVIIPMVAIVIDEKFHENFPLLIEVAQGVGIGGKKELVTVFVILFFILICLKAAVTLLIVATQKRLTAEIRVHITSYLFGHLIRLPFGFHMAENSAKILRNLTTDVSAYIRSLEAVVVLISESLLVLALFAVLTVVDPAGLALILLLVVGAVPIYVRKIQSKITSWGRKFRKEAAEMTRHTQQALGGIKEIKVLSREQYFEELFKTSNVRLVDYERRYSIVQAIPVNALEVLVALGLIGILISAHFAGRDLDELLPILAVFLASAVRLAPALARMVAAIQSLRYIQASMSALVERLKQRDPIDSPTRPSAVSRDSLVDWQTLKIKDLSFTYPTRTSFALQDVSLTLLRGTSLGIIGESGSGKSTLVDIILGLNERYDGSISLDGVDLNESLIAWRNQIGYVPQAVYLIDDTIKRNIAFGIEAESVDLDRLERAIRSAQLSDFVNGLEDGVDSIVGERGARISGGQQQRIGIARALYRNPSVLILDEATSALDSKTETEFMSTISAMKGSLTMIIIAHRLTTLKNCDRLIRLNQGKIVATGSYQDLVGTPVDPVVGKP